MKKFIAIAIVSFGIPGVAFAQSCVTTGPAETPKSCIAGGVPQLSGLSGAVSLVRAGRVLPAENGMQLMAGDRLITRGSGAGNLAIGGAQGGSCSAAIAATSITTLSRSGGLLCVSQRSISPASTASERIDSGFRAQAVESTEGVLAGTQTAAGSSAGGTTTAAGGVGTAASGVGTAASGVGATVAGATAGVGIASSISPLVLAIGGSALAGAAGIAISQSVSDKNRLSP
jgi:hypothetical protein